MLNLFYIKNKISRLLSNENDDYSNSALFYLSGINIKPQGEIFKLPFSKKV
ncbi:MAG: hypothetical protein U5Q03_06455 [Bacteroidota bacterium]|nr:hypothetical protein [Bacteroidota bacterium]